MDALTRAYLALALTPGLGPRKIKLLTEHFGDAERVCGASARELQEVPGLGPKLASSLLDAKGSVRPERELERAARLYARVLHLAHPDYPEALRRIYDPPPVLFVRGALPKALQGELQSVRSVAIVGTRDASDYALHLARALARGLAEAGVTVVSGLARGVDAAAHHGACAAPDGRTVAVLGSGVDVVYPRDNQALAQTIVGERNQEGKGALVSEYPVGTGPRPEHFPARNRIVAGLARAVVVVEGTRKSGSMITASLALEEGRTVFAVPGRAGDPKAGGTLDLLKQGAVLTQDASDILSELGWTAPLAAESGPPLSEDERALVTIIRSKDSPLLDDLIAASGKSAGTLLPLLTVLELKGIVKAVPGGRYISLLRG